MIPRAIQRLSSRALPSVVAGAGVVVLLAWDRDPSQASAEEGLKKDNQIGALPIFKRAEVAKHTTPDSRIWVTYKDGVYNITRFVVNHPGGSEKIMLAAGKAIDPFWRIYQQHTGRGNAEKILADMKIGELSDPPTEIDASDPFSSDPQERHPGLIFHNTKPCNAEVPPSLQKDHYKTPNDLWFIRHHHPVPIIDPKKFRLTVEGKGTRRMIFTLEDLKERFPKRQVTTTIQCGGNRRSELDKVEKTSGIAWGHGAMSTAEWGGVYLREVLQQCCGLTNENIEFDDVKHVIFHGMDDMQASIPIHMAVGTHRDVLLAYEMNGVELPPEHGYPVRAIVPGVVGVRNVKWVTRIEPSSEEALGPWQRGISYKGFSPMIKEFKNVNIESVLSIQEMPITSAILEPTEGFVTELDDIDLRGFAWSGGGRGIVRTLQILNLHQSLN